MTRHGHRDASTDLSEIEAWWRRWPTANIGLAIPSGFFIVDLDSPDAAAQLRAEGCVLPTTASATTGRGRHLWYACGSTVVRNQVGFVNGLDIRSVGGYVVVPPSLHPNGNRYQWSVPFRRESIAEAPDSLLGRLTAPDTSSSAASDATWHQRIAQPVTEGGRNQALAQVAGLLFRRLPAPVAAEMALCWASVKLQPPLPQQETMRTIDSIAGRELRRRQGVS